MLDLAKIGTAECAFSEKLGKYRLLKKLSSDSAAEVYLAVLDGPEGFSKPIVIKAVEVANAGEVNSALALEAKLAAELTHPNIAHVLDFGNVDNRFFLAIEWVDGISLRDLVKRATERNLELGPKIAAAIGFGLCNALSYVQAISNSDGAPLGLIHSDITPSNIMISSTGIVKLTDFGMVNLKSAVAARLEKDKRKFDYMSPEQVANWLPHSVEAKAEDIDGRSDIFAAGIIMYELATQRRLFPNRDPRAPLVIHRPSSISASVSKDLEAIILKALALKKEDRYQTADAMLEEIESFLISSGQNERELAALVATAFPSGEESGLASYTPLVRVASHPLSLRLGVPRLATDSSEEAQFARRGATSSGSPFTRKSRSLSYRGPLPPPIPKALRIKSAIPDESQDWSEPTRPERKDKLFAPENPASSETKPVDVSPVKIKAKKPRAMPSSIDSVSQQEEKPQYLAVPKNKAQGNQAPFLLEPTRTGDKKVLLPNGSESGRQDSNNLPSSISGAATAGNQAGQDPSRPNWSIRFFEMKTCKMVLSDNNSNVSQKPAPAKEDSRLDLFFSARRPSGTAPKGISFFVVAILALLFVAGTITIGWLSSQKSPASLLDADTSTREPHSANPNSNESGPGSAAIDQSSANVQAPSLTDAPKPSNAPTNGAAAVPGNDSQKQGANSAKENNSSNSANSEISNSATEKKPEKRRLRKRKKSNDLSSDAWEVRDTRDTEKGDTGEVDVQTNEFDGEVWINNRLCGNPPLLEKNVAVGTATVEFRQNDGVTRKAKVSVRAGKRAIVRFR